eukprot:2855328-Rhodomonas_salina.1
MKRFTRDYLSADNGLKDMLVASTLQYFRSLSQTWDDATNFGCPCTDGTRGFPCCSVEDED